MGTQKIVYIRGEFLIDIFNNYKPLSGEYVNLLKKTHMDRLLRTMIDSDFMSYGGAYVPIEEEYPSYLDVESWIALQLGIEDPDPLGEIMDILQPISKDILVRLDEELCSMIHIREYLASFVELVDFDKGTFIVTISRKPDHDTLI